MSPEDRAALRALEAEAEALADSIAGCFSNVSDLPEWMQVEALGRSMRPLTLIAARAVLASDWLASRDNAADERDRLVAGIEALAELGARENWTPDEFRAGLRALLPTREQEAGRDTRKAL